MSKQVHFFATPVDLKSVLSRVEADVKVQYVPNGLFEIGTLHSTQSLAEASNLGINLTGKPFGAGGFFVLSRGKQVPLKQSKLAYSQGLKEEFDGDKSHDWIYFEPGGVAEIPEQKIRIVVGKLGITKQTIESESLYRVFKKHISKCFEKFEHRSLIGNDAKSKLFTSEIVW
jgi:hypothetical protein